MEYKTDMRGIWKLAYSHAIKTHTIEESQETGWKAVYEAIEQYVIKARIEELEKASTEGTGYDVDLRMANRLAELKKGLTDEQIKHESDKE